MTETQLQMISELEEVESGLSCKELDFIDQLSRWADAGDYIERSLSEKQNDWLESIYKRLCV